MPPVTAGRPPRPGPAAGPRTQNTPGPAAGPRTQNTPGPAAGPRTRSAPHPARGAALLLAAALALALAGCAEKVDPALRALPGYPVYKSTCMRCHGGRGDAAKASRVAHRRVDLSSPAFRDTTTLADVEVVVTKGKGKMKGYEDELSGVQITAVSRFVLALSAPTPPDSAARVR